VAISQVGWSAYSQADAFAIGRNLGDVSLGIYRMALNLAVSPIDKIAVLVTQVAAPIFSRVQTDHALMRRYILRFTELVSLATVPVSVGLASIAPELVGLMLGEKWLAVTVPLQILSLTFALRCYALVLSNAVLALRQASFLMYVNLINMIVICILFWMASFVSIEAVALCWLITLPLNVIASVVRIRTVIGLNVFGFVGAGLPAALGGGLIFAIVFMTRQSMLASDFTPFSILATSVGVGATSYIAFLFLFFRERTLKYLQFARDLRTNRAVPPS
jgi:PST family polysaccharide transporter